MARPSKRALERARQLAPDPSAAPVITVRTYRFTFPDAPRADLRQTQLPRPPVAPRPPLPLEPLDTGPGFIPEVASNGVAWRRQSLDPRFLAAHPNSLLGMQLRDLARHLGVHPANVSYEDFGRYRMQLEAEAQRERMERERTERARTERVDAAFPGYRERDRE